MQLSCSDHILLKNLMKNTKKFIEKINVVKQKYQLDSQKSRHIKVIQF